MQLVHHFEKMKSRSSLREYFDELGNIHDGRISEIKWNFESSTFEVSIDDAHCNFVGLPEYLGRQPVKFTFGGVNDVSLELSSSASFLRIYELKVESPIGGKSKLLLSLSPAGRIEMMFSDASCVEQM